MISAIAWSAAGAGLLFGSFLNVCISRLPEHRSIAWPGSHCPVCKTPIRPLDNVPLLSFLLLRGRCRACSCAISWRYPLVELALAVLWGACFAWLAWPQALAGSVFCFLMLGLFAMDAETFLLPDAFTLPGAALGVAVALTPGSLAGISALRGVAPFPLPHWSPVVSSLLGAGACAGVLFLIRISYKMLRGREGMGIGDIKLALLLGAWLGLAGGMLALLLGVLAGALAAVWVGLRKQAGLRAELPFGSALALGGVGTLFCGHALLRWYFSFWR